MASTDADAEATVTAYDDALRDGDPLAPSSAGEVFLARTDTERPVRYEFDTRLSGTLERRGEGWQSVGIHAGTAGEP